ncbi:hypothetical protein [Nonomuraea sp. NPDC046570]|uniref:hypothetical protein n=1 Tax=Nonomuraea sp. NPDC046570 TaxID=3155255 RepID=UPI0033E2FF74
MAGRVLSDRNLKRMRQAVEILQEIMKEAGAWEDPDEHDPTKHQHPEMPIEPTIMPDSTAPSALPSELKQLTTEQLGAGRAVLDFLASA